MATTKIIRPYIKLSLDGSEGIQPEEAAILVKRGIWVTLASRADVIKTLVLLGCNPEDIASSIHYALNGDTEGILPRTAFA